MLEARFKRVLSGDRVFPQVFTSAGGNFDHVPSKERAEVLRVSSILFSQRFVQNNRSDLLVYCPSRLTPLKVDDWLLRKETKTLNSLPVTALEAKKSLSHTNKLYPLLCVEEWSVDYRSGSKGHYSLSKAETHCLQTIDGWSLCFSDSKLPDDFGQSINSMAEQMAREDRAAGIKRKGPGRTRKVDGLIERIQVLYPNGIPNKSAKQITRDLGETAPIDFSETTLRQALKKISNMEKQLLSQRI